MKLVNKQISYCPNLLAILLPAYSIPAMKIKILTGCLFLLIWQASSAQVLQPGFDAQEYLDMLSITFGKYDSVRTAHGQPVNYHWNYRSQVVGLDNRWNLFLRDDQKVGVISIRGTVGTTPSWLANIYAVMQPATGDLKLNDSTNFHYKLSDNENATVHTGWLISMASLADDVERKIRQYYDKGVKDFIIIGHSQGGGIAYLLRSYLYYHTKSNVLPADITFKTYCSAAPKPGNVYYAYDYDFINRGGWSFTVVNAADWVPETPMSIQRLKDLNPLNPFMNIKEALRHQKFFVRVYAGTVYNKLTKVTHKAVKKYQKYLGKKVGKEAAKKMPQLEKLHFSDNMNYQRTGTTIILMPDSAYYQQFPNDVHKGVGIWNHHTYEAYDRLVRKDYMKQ